MLCTDLFAHLLQPVWMPPQLLSHGRADREPQTNSCFCAILFRVLVSSRASEFSFRLSACVCVCTEWSGVRWQRVCIVSNVII